MSNYVHNRKRRQIAAASLHMLAMSGDFNAQLQFNVAEARSIAYETDSRRLLRKNAFDKADKSTRRLFSNMQQMRASAQTPWQKQQVALLAKLLTKARENVLAHLSDPSAQTAFILLSQFLGISPELDQVHRADHSAKLDAAAFAAKMSMSFIPGAGPVLGTLARSGIRVHSTQHSVSRRKGEEVQFDQDASNIVPTGAADADCSVSSMHREEHSAATFGVRRTASTADAATSMSSNLQRRPQSFAAGMGNASRHAHGGRERSVRRSMRSREGARGVVHAPRAQRDMNAPATASAVRQNSTATGGSVAPPRETSIRTAGTNSGIGERLANAEAVQGANRQGVGAEMSEQERRAVAIELYRKQRNKLQAMLILKARDKQAKGIAAGKRSEQTSATRSGQGKPLLAQKKKETNEFLVRLEEHVGRKTAG